MCFVGVEEKEDS